MGYEIHEFRGSYLSFVGEKWQNLPFLGKTTVLVPVPKVGTVPMDRDQVVLVLVVSTGTDASCNPDLCTLALLSPIFIHQLFRDLDK